MLAVILAGASGWSLAGPGAATRRLALVAQAAGQRNRRPAAAGAARHQSRYQSRHLLRWVTRRARSTVVPERLRRTATIELCEALAAELRAGRNPAEAVRRAIEVTPPSFADELRPTLAAAEAGTDVSETLWEAGARPGAAGLRRLAVCFRVGVVAGGAFAPAVERLGVALRDEEAARQDVNAQLAGARATARLLAALPFLGTVLGAGLGVHPFAFWFGSLAGFGCLVVGVLLDVLGLLWMGRLARAAEAAP